MKRPIVITLLVLALLFVLAGIGGVVFFATRGSGDFFTGRMTDHATIEENKILKVDAETPVKLKVVNGAGNVTIIGADVTTVQVDVVKTAYATSQARADEEVKKIKYDIDQAGNTITLTYEYPTIRTSPPNIPTFNTNSDTVDFVVTVPTEATIDINTKLGEVSVTSIKGNVAIDNSFGDISVQNIEGALTVSNNSGEIEATGIKAGSDNIELNSDFGNITLEQANAANITFDSNSGKVTLKDVNATGDFSSNSDFGDTKFENGTAASVTIESKSGKVALTKVKVSKLIKVQDDFGDITLTQAMATSYDLHTNSGSVTVDGAKGTLKAYTDFGNIEVTNAQAVTLNLVTKSGSVEFSGSLGTGPHTVATDFGNITLALPTDSKLDVDLKTDFGKIKSDLPITVTVTGSSSSDKEEIAGAVNGGGAQLTVKTNSGSININAMK
ncbi:MAG: DUF4097 family beta strand repeat protein [Anaerolineales bacterium]|nr:DUF4097 family beta strand repeat protein [Anaerolineales bacterium]